MGVQLYLSFCCFWQISLWRSWVQGDPLVLKIQSLMISDAPRSHWPDSRSSYRSRFVVMFWDNNLDNRIQVLDNFHKTCFATLNYLLISLAFSWWRSLAGKWFFLGFEIVIQIRKQVYLLNSIQVFNMKIILLKTRWQTPEWIDK